MKINLLLPPERLFTMDGQPIHANDTQSNPYGRPDGYKVLQTFYYRCPVTGEHVVLSPNALIDKLWNGRPSCFPPHLVDLLAPFGAGFDFVSPGGLQVRLLVSLDEMGKMSSRWFADVLRILEIDPRENAE